MSGHWLTGYGYVGVGPGTDEVNARTGFAWRHRDLTSIYIRQLAHYGLLGLLPFLVVNFLYYRALARAYRYAVTRADRWLLWCITGALVGWNLGMLTVSPMEQGLYLLYLWIGACGSLQHIMRGEYLDAERFEMEEEDLEADFEPSSA